MTKWGLISTVISILSLLAYAEGRPNIILITADGMGPNMTGFEGNPTVKTPNLDRLVENSLLFTHCYTPTPQTSPSQASILTGQYPHKHSLTSNGMALPKNTDTFTAMLKKEGYLCGIIGGWALNNKDAKAPGFGLIDYIATVGYPWSGKEQNVWVQGKTTKIDKFLPDWLTDRAVEFIDKQKDKTFFLWLSFCGPGGNTIYPPGTESQYPPAKVDLPDTKNISHHKMSRIIKDSQAAKDYKKKEKTIRQERSKYYAMITRIDQNLGRVLDGLDQSKCRDKTALVFACTGGTTLGEYKLYGRGPMFFDRLVRGPLVISIPNITKKGSKIGCIVSLVDLAPTFCQLAGIHVPITINGQSLLPAIKNPQSPNLANERFLEYHKQKNKPYPARCIITNRYKYIDYQNSNDILYDLKRDPRELDNLISRWEYEAVVDVLHKRLDHWKK
jgi:arylsulfatase A-like enzyme